jgi:hypothetical protein
MERRLLDPRSRSSAPLLSRAAIFVSAPDHRYHALVRPIPNRATINFHRTPSARNHTSRVSSSSSQRSHRSASSIRSMAAGDGGLRLDVDRPALETRQTGPGLPGHRHRVTSRRHAAYPRRNDRGTDALVVPMSRGSNSPHTRVDARRSRAWLWQRPSWPRSGRKGAGKTWKTPGISSSNSRL